mmetsp:Transcript_63792/g.152127  ORF Transcript_63792/g.152127 Transcript_63792/m.152127 type:complete len:325 (-) Transcript_63792:226-1200(-)
MKKWKPEEAINQRRVSLATPAFIALAHAAGMASRPPGANRARGSSTAVATAVNTASWFVFRVVASSPMSPTEPNLVARTLRVTKKKLEAIAVANPNAVNESSLADAKATPANTGSSEQYTRGWKTWPSKKAEATAFTAGSKALTTWVKLTATAPKEATVATCPPAKAAPTGASLASSPAVTLGFFKSPVIHISPAIGIPAAIWIQDTAMLASKAFSRSLFWMLYCTLKKYHRHTYTGSFTADQTLAKPLSSALSSALSSLLLASAAIATAAKAVAATIMPGFAASWSCSSMSLSVAKATLGVAGCATPAKDAADAGFKPTCCGS